MLKDLRKITKKHQKTRKKKVQQNAKDPRKFTKKCQKIQESHEKVYQMIL
ncbi:19818_t:CDS:2 [Racocetra fulgida]|uniref:19818_t:CDS:1 n=1 Tax=Racocetra fulgida TaxID=60492 RepID=A0A9N8W3Q1_9GLOM|nr:19818_t:CDS:2 [Racocetra fulgida]